MQPSPSKCHPDNLVGFVFISFSIGCANVVNDISVVCADLRGGDDAVVVDPSRTSVVENVVVVFVSAVFAVAVAGVFVVTDIAIFILFFSP